MEADGKTNGRCREGMSSQGGKNKKKNMRQRKGEIVKEGEGETHKTRERRIDHVQMSRWKR